MESMESIIESLEWTAEDELALRIEKKAIMEWNGIIDWWTMKQRWRSNQLHQQTKKLNFFDLFDGLFAELQQQPQNKQPQQSTNKLKFF